MDDAGGVAAPGRVVEGTLTGAGGVRLTHWGYLPPGPVRAVVLLVHGYGEHQGRYAHVIAALTGGGHAVHTLDHRGHGRSPGRRAVIDRFDDLVDDLHLLALSAREAQPQAPMFLVGHSMGGLIALRYALRHQASLAGAILSSPALRFGEDTPAFLVRLAPLLARLLPMVPVSRLRPAESLLSRDSRVQERFDDDPLCYTGPMRLRTGYQLRCAALDARARLEELTLPLLLLHGDADRLVDPAGSVELYRRAGSRDKSLRRWPNCRHELLNEPEQGEVIACMLAWLDRRAPVRSGVAGAPPSQVARFHRTIEPPSSP
jgi:acylglycerol lipase